MLKIKDNVDLQELEKYEFEKQHWGTLLDMNEIEYLTIRPMLEKEND